MTQSSETPVLEIGGTHVTAACVDLSAPCVVADTVVRHGLDGHACTDEFIATILAAARSLPLPDARVWGVAIPGPFDYARGICHFHNVGKFDALRGLDLGARLRAELTSGTGRVQFVNDAQAFLIGEWVAGVAAGHHRVIGVTLGTGVGSAFLSGGAVVDRGPGVPPQGHLHLLTVAGASLEDMISRRAIRDRYAVLLGTERTKVPDLREIAERVRTGDEIANLAMREPLEALGEVLAPRAIAFGASRLVVGGSIARSWDVVKAALQSGMDRAEPGWWRSVELVRGQRLEESALLGAASVVATGSCNVRCRNGP